MSLALRTRTITTRWLLLLLIACGGRTSTPVHPDRGSAAPQGSGHPASEVPPSDTDCDALIAHAVALAAADQPAATDDDQAQARVDMKAKYGAACRAMARADYLCALSAPSLVAFADCQATRSSST